MDEHNKSLADQERRSRVLFVIAGICLLSAATSWIFASKLSADTQSVSRELPNPQLDVGTRGDGHSVNDRASKLSLPGVSLFQITRG